MAIQLKRIYEDISDDDGYRVLVDRMWPRGVAKKDAEVDYWPKEMAPSRDLRQWFGHDRKRWDEFRKAYKKELAECDSEIVDTIQKHAREEGVTLLFAAKDTECNNAVVIKSWLEGKS